MQYRRYTLGWTHAGEWTGYIVNVKTAGTYQVSFHVAPGQGSGKMHLESNGTDLNGVMEIPNTKGFQNGTVIDREIRLDAGEHVLKVVIDGDFVNLDRMNFETSQ